MITNRLVAGEPFVDASLVPTPASASVRFASIDALRGLVMILMVLDHVRFFFTNTQFSPEDMTRTTLPLFITRWVTHFCAPVFFLLAGVGARLTVRDRSALARHLRRRGLFLVMLELTVVGFAWSFNPGSSFAGVIWALGWSMILLSFLVRLPPKWSGVFGVTLVFGHHVLDGIRPGGGPLLAALWRFLHVPGMADVGPASYLVLYPLIPWVGVMTIGYAMGDWFFMAPRQRQIRLLMAGSASVLLFWLLRISNVYGNPGLASGEIPEVFRMQESLDLSLIAFLNVEKYPPSLQFLLMTLGPALLLVAGLEWVEKKGHLREARDLTAAIGRTALFFYILHLFVIHLLALVIAMLSGQPHEWLSWKGSGQRPPDYGYGLPVVYGLSILVVTLLYPASRWFERLERSRNRKWLRYL